MSGPEKTFRNEDAKGLELTAWKNDKGNISFKFRKSYKVKDSNPAEYKETNYMFPNELVVMADLCTKAKVWHESLSGGSTDDAEVVEETTTTPGVTFETDDSDIPF